jgi:Tfp pilus assembly protein PilF
MGREAEGADVERIALVIGFLGLTVSALAQSAKVEVAPTAVVTRKTYPVPANEAPFFNFVEKNEGMKAADEKLLASVLQRIPDRAQAAGTAITAGMRAFQRDRDPATAAMRFNQGYLLDPQQSGVYHGFAMVAEARFKDYEYADELFRIAARMKSPAPTLAADHGRMFLIAGRPDDAKPLLEKAVKDAPDWAVPRMNLAWAVLQMGQRDEACRLKEQVKGGDLDALEQDLAAFKQMAGC